MGGERVMIAFGHMYHLFRTISTNVKLTVGNICWRNPRLVEVVIQRTDIYPVVLEF
jgi:hypothetical protein